MRFFRLSRVILLSCLLAPLSAHAQESPRQGSEGTLQGDMPSPGEKPPAVNASVPNSQQALFEALKRERDADKARGIANQIVSNWRQSGSATVDLLMQWAAKSVSDKNNGAALDFLDQVTVLQPDYADAWNRRATLHYTMGDLRKSMADINQVLSKEPRYFPAIAGMATILTDSGEEALALKAWERYLAVYPADRDAQENLQKLSEKLAGSRT
jgi:tetratricopeptide (TPR) repeat protein